MLRHSALTQGAPTELRTFDPYDILGAPRLQSEGFSLSLSKAPSVFFNSLRFCLLGLLLSVLGAI